MKMTLFYAAFICSVVAACQNANTAGNNADNDETKEEKKKISKRDYSITKANSYSDLFLDSTAMEQFMSAKKIPDSIARRLRSFYNARNYQFAWFTSNSLTEQARGFWNLHDYVTTYDVDTTL